MQRKLKFWGLLSVMVLAATLFLPMATPVQADSLNHTTVVLPSGVTGPNGEVTKTAGYTGTDPSASVTYVSGTDTLVARPSFSSAPSLLPADLATYSWSPASTFTGYPAWVTISGAQWVSTTSANYGVETANEGDTWRLFKTTFNIPQDVTSASIQIAGDNAYEFYLNGHLVATTADFDPSAPVYGSWPGSGSQAPFIDTNSFTLPHEYLITGANTLLFVVRNWDNSGSGNPSGLIYKVTLTSGPISLPTPASYSLGKWLDANPVSYTGYWTAIDGAQWVSTTTENAGVETANEGDTWRLFKEDFNIPADATSISGTIEIAGDNAYEVYLNGHLVDTTALFNPSAPVYGSWPGSGSQAPFTSIASFILPFNYFVTGANTLMFVVRNWDNNGSDNPSGLIYKATLDYDVPSIPAQVWYLNSINHPEMEKTFGIQQDSVSIEKGATVTWLSDQAAINDVAFSSGTWTVKLVTGDWGTDKCLVQIGDYDTTGDTFTAFNTTPAIGLYNGGIITITINTGGTVYQGDYLALSIKNGSGASQTIITEGNSYLTPPIGSPDYPMPEMASGILLGGGLIGLVGYMAIRKKKSNR